MSTIRGARQQHMAVVAVLRSVQDIENRPRWRVPRVVTLCRQRLCAGFPAAANSALRSSRRTHGPGRLVRAGSLPPSSPRKRTHQTTSDVFVSQGVSASSSDITIRSRPGGRNYPAEPSCQRPHGCATAAGQGPPGCGASLSPQSRRVLGSGNPCNVFSCRSYASCRAR